MAAHIDGNVLAGPFSEVFRFDVTAASARCVGCGVVSLVAEATAYSDAPGLVVRCVTCDHVLATLVDAGDCMFLSLTGMSAIELRR